MKKQLIPQLRFPEFTSSWKKKYIKSIAKIVGGGTPSTTNDEYWNGEINWFTPTEIKFNVVSESNRKITGMGLNNSSATLLPKGTILLTTRATIGKVAITQEECTTNQGFQSLIVNKSNSNQFVFDLIKVYRNELYKRANGSTFKEISKKEIEKIKVLIPQLPEQQKIANFLSAVDTRIQNLEKKKELLEQYKKGITQKIFKQEIRFKDDNGKAFPEWEHTRLGEHIYKTGKKNKENIQYPIYSINNQEGFRPQSEQFEGLDSNERGYDISLYKVIKEKTFAYNPARINVGSIGYSGNLSDIIISSLYVCFKTKEKLEDVYLLKYLDTFQFNKDVLRFSEGGVRQYLFYENISKIKIPLPSNEEQQKIANFLSAIDQRINLVTQQITHTKTYKKGLLQQMFV